MISLKFIRFKANHSVLLALTVAVAFFSTAGTPARALNPGCYCPAGSTPIGANRCLAADIIPAICTGGAINQSAGHLAASSQQLSFWGIQQILEGRRDQLQGTLGRGKARAMISGYAPSEFDQDADTFSDALGYASQSKQGNPLASPVYKAPPAPPAPMNTGPSWAAWMQGLGDWEHDAAAAPADQAHSATTYAGQGGIDGTWQNLTPAGDALVVGLVGGWTHAHVGYDGTPTTTNMEGPGAGIYTTYVLGGFSTDVTGKLDFLHLGQDFAGVVPDTSVNLTNAGVSANIQYKNEFSGGGFFEPTGGVSFTRTMFGEGGAALGLADSSTVRLQAGARLGTTWTVNGISVEPSLKALAYDNVIADGSSSASASAAGIVPTDQGKVRGQVEPNVNWDFGNGSSLTLSGLVRFGDGMLGGSANVNLRKQW